MISKRIRSPIFVAIIGMMGCGSSPSSTGVQTQPPPPAISPGEINLQYNYAPSSRTIGAASVYKVSGTLQNPGNVLTGQAPRLTGMGSSVTLDFGKEVGGIITLRFSGASDSNQTVGLAFSESSLYVGPESDRSNGGTGPDGAIYAQVSGTGSYTMPIEELRGGFRYLTVFLSSDGWVDLSGVTLQFSAAPTMADLRAYSNYFYSNDELLNRIWYAGAYTLQMDTIDPAQGITWPPVSSGWQNTGLLGGGRSIVVDGAKRDRTVWPGDIGISQLTALVSTYDTESTQNTLTALYQNQTADGMLPYAGPPINYYGSDTYHLWTLVATADYFLFSADKTWLDSHWNQYKSAVQYSMKKIDANGVLSVDQPYDWGRTAQTAGEAIEANALLYRVLTTGAELARVEGDSDTAAAYSAAAQSMKQSINTLFWDAAAGQYTNTPGDHLYPQDGNALALWYGLADSPAKATSASQALRKNWNSYGAQSPEKPNAIGTFPGSMEVHGHFAAGDDQTALDLIRLEWGYMLNSPIGSGSTFWEGYLADGTLEPSTPDGIGWYPAPYLGSYMSLAHGWSTGPTSALTLYVLGVAPVMSGGITYSMIPHPGDLTHVEGKVMMPNGPVLASWTRNATAGTFSQSVDTPLSALGRIGVPTFGRPVVIYVDKQLVWNNCSGSSNASVASIGFAAASTDGVYVYLDKMNGNHTIESSIRCAGGSS